MKRLLAVLILTAAPVLATSQQHYRNAQALTVLVTNEGFLGGGRGSGVLVDKTHVVTYAHMVASMNDELFVYTYPLGKVTKAHAEYIDVSNDLMLLVLDAPVDSKDFAKFEEKTYEGEPITIVGNALGSMKWLVSHGIVAGTEREYLLTDVQINPGNSGGPWVNEYGYVVAITDWGIDPKRGPGVTGGISAKKINAMFKAYQASKNLMKMFSKLFGGS